jgi:hypothetical protein
MLARAVPERPCAVLLEIAAWQALYGAIHHCRTPPDAPLALGEAIRWIAQLGGFVGQRRRDQPGPETLWRGLQYLTDLTRMYRIMRYYRAARRLADTIGHVPVLILVCATAQGPSGAASVIPSVQNLLLAARALGIGGTITTCMRKLRNACTACATSRQRRRSSIAFPWDIPKAVSDPMSASPCRKSVPSIVGDRRAPGCEGRLHV